MLTAETDRSAYSLGETVNITLTLTNDSAAEQTYQFNTSQRYDVVIKRDNGQTVWVWSHGRMFMQVLGSVTLQPGESITYVTGWNGTSDDGYPVAAGRYEVCGEIVSTNQPERDCTAITLS